MAATQTEAVLNKLSKQELLPLFANIEANLGSKISAMSSEIKDLMAYFRKLDAGVLKNVN